MPEAAVAEDADVAADRVSAGAVESRVTPNRIDRDLYGNSHRDARLGLQAWINEPYGDGNAPSGAAALKRVITNRFRHS
jgi:hypothetical protein